MGVAVLEKLVDYYHENKISHAYLLETNNLQKCFEDLKLIVKKICCPNNFENDCTCCNICNLIDQDYLPTFKVIEPIGNSIKKEQILELKREFGTIPIYTKENIYIIKRAEKLTDSSANTMLKFIEEPEDHIIGFFITDNINNVISTIRSRCEVLKVIYDEHELNVGTILAPENKDMLNVISTYLYKIEVEKKDGILYNKDVLLSVYKERDEIRKIFQIILLVYTELLKKLLKQDNKFNELKLEFLEKLNVIEVNNRINMLIEFIDNLETNANVELLLDRFVIELGEENE